MPKNDLHWKTLKLNNYDTRRKTITIGRPQCEVTI